VSLWAAFSGYAKAESCTTQESKARGIITDDYGFEAVTLHFFSKGLCDQINSLENFIDFKKATSVALDSFLTDSSHPESPLALMIDYAFEDLGVEYKTPIPSEVRTHADYLLRIFLNRPSTTLRILPLDEFPEQGENPQTYWIFHLKMADFSDHSYWSLVHREGFRATYNYGFN
jgi:hypothetical protein